jgi:hypothetical protein
MGRSVESSVSVLALMSIAEERQSDPFRERTFALRDVICKCVHQVATLGS